MARLQFYFQDETQPQLREVILTTRSGIRNRSVRGKTAGTEHEAGTFQWTAAVKGLCLLALRTLEKVGGVRGEAGSAAAALDYALSKPPLWMQELFGSDRQGHPLAARYFLRTNPERKRPGPVSICFHPSQVSADDIEVYVDERKLSCEESAKLGDTLESNFRALKPLLPSHFSTEQRTISSSGLERNFQDVLRDSLRARNIFLEVS